MDVTESPSKLRQRAAEAKRIATLTTDPDVAAEVLALAATYESLAARIERTETRVQH